MKTFFQAVTDYIEAGLDESLAQFVKGICASAVMAAGLYAYHHLNGHGLSIVGAVLAMGIGTPALISFWKWAKTTSGNIITTQPEQII